MGDHHEGEYIQQPCRLRGVRQAGPIQRLAWDERGSDNRLVAGADTDYTQVYTAGTDQVLDYRPLALNVVHYFGVPGGSGWITLQCESDAARISVENIGITAIRASTLINTPIN